LVPLPPKYRDSRLLGPLPAIYHVCEAKFVSETADGVGKCPTSLTVLFDRDKTAIVPEHYIDSIRSRWKAEGCPRIPTGILSEIETYLEWWHRESGAWVP